MLGVGNDGQEDQQREGMQPPEHGNRRAARGHKEGREVSDHQKEDEKCNEARFPGELCAKPARADKEPAHEEAKDADGTGQGKDCGEPEVEAPKETFG